MVPPKEGERLVLGCPEMVDWGELDDTNVVGRGEVEIVRVVEGELDELASRVVGLGERVGEEVMETVALIAEETVAIPVVGAGVKV
jgi:hypothetical protein